MATCSPVTGSCAPLGFGGMGEVYLVATPAAAPPGRAEDPARRDVGGHRVPRPVQPGGRAGRHALPPAHRRHARSRRVRRGSCGSRWTTSTGRTPARCCASSIPTGMPPWEVVDIVAAVADALDYAHDRGSAAPRHQAAQHSADPARARTPARSCWRTSGSPATPPRSAGSPTPTSPSGTVNYAAPEQLMGAPFDGRADQYGLAATAYHLLSGRRCSVRPIRRS